jgi:hypothetical protein
VSRADLPPSVLWRNRQTEVCLVLRPKPRNRRGDFETQIIKQAKLGKTVATSFEAKLVKTVAVGFEAKPLETVATSFKAKPVKTVRVVLRPNHSQTVDLGFEAQPRNPCF